MADHNKVMLVWTFERLSSLLDFPVPEDLTKYILSIENARDLEEYLKTLLDFKNKEHKQFLEELLQKRQSAIAQAKKSGQENIFPSKGNTAKKNIIKVNKTKNEESSDKEAPKDAKKKPNFVPLYSADGNDVVLLKGRHRCDCQASKHGLVNNCLSCGRIVCEQEGSGPCLFCNQLVCTSEELQTLSSGTKRSDKLHQRLVDQKRPHGWENAIQQRNRLLEYDRTSQIRTHVIDDESDYFAANSVWLSKEERDKLKLREDEIQAKRHVSRLDRKLTFDFSGRQVVEEQDDSYDSYLKDDSILREISQSIEKPTGSINNPNLHPGINICSQPIFQKTVSQTKSVKTESRSIRKLGNINRVQDKQFLEMCDDGLCLSMHQPYASLLTGGIKMHEGRSWYSSHRGRLWIAATAKTPIHQEIEEMTKFYTQLNNDNIRFPSEYPVRCLLGYVNVVDVLSQEEYRVKYPRGESTCPFVFICEDPHELPIRFPIVGQHKIYKLDAKLHQAAQKSLQRLAKLQAESVVNHN